MAGLFDETQHLPDIPAPEVEHLVDRSLLLEGDDPGWSIDTRVDGLVSHQFAQCPLGRDWWQVEELGQAGHGYARVVGGDHPDILSSVHQLRLFQDRFTYMLDDPLVQLLPSCITRVLDLLGLLAFRFRPCLDPQLRFNGKNWRLAQGGPIQSFNPRPAHELFRDETLQQVTVGRLARCHLVQVETHW